MDAVGYCVIMLAAMGAFVFFNEVFLLPYMTPTSYADAEMKSAEPYRGPMVVLVSLLDYALICVGAWSGNKFWLLAHEGREQTQPGMIGR